MSNRRISAGAALRKTALVVISLLWAVPTWLLWSTRSSPAAQYGGSPHWWPHGGFGLFDNMSQAWARARLGPAMGNSLLYAVTSAAAAILVATTAAFATVIMPVKRRTLWFWLIYSGTLLPLQVFLRPLFLAYANTGLYDAQAGLFLVYVAVAIPFAYFIMRNFARTLPGEVIEAARLDGASGGGSSGRSTYRCRSRRWSPPSCSSSWPSGTTSSSASPSPPAGTSVP